MTSNANASIKQKEDSEEIVTGFAVPACSPPPLDVRIILTASPLKVKQQVAVQ